MLLFPLLMGWFIFSKTIKNILNTNKLLTNLRVVISIADLIDQLLNLIGVYVVYYTLGLILYLSRIQFLSKLIH